MKNTLCSFLYFGLAGFAQGASLMGKADEAAAKGLVQVEFAQAEKYTDLRDGDADTDNEKGRQYFLPLLKEHLEKEAGRRLASGQQLVVIITDIDLAGDYEPWRGFQWSDVRIVKDIYIPRMTLSFKLTEASGHVVKEGERKLADPAFQMNLSGGFRDDALRYDKQLLTDWLRRELMVEKK